MALGRRPAVPFESGGGVARHPVAFAQQGGEAHLRLGVADLGGPFFHNRVQLERVQLARNVRKMKAGTWPLAKMLLPNNNGDLLQMGEECGVDLAFEIHPGEDLHDGVSYERFLAACGQHQRACILFDPSHFVLQALDYLKYLDIYHERIRAFHVKDAEFEPTGRCGVYGGFQDWADRPGRFRSVGDGQVDWGGVFSRLAQYDYPGWAVVEWECCFKDSELGASEGAAFVKDSIIRVTDRAFDDFAGGQADQEGNRRILGLEA